MQDMNLLTVKQVAAKLSVSVGHVWKLAQRDETFPKSFGIGMGGQRQRGTRWIESQVDAWIADRYNQGASDGSNGDPTNEESLDDRGHGREVHQPA
jgi:predicted DNA-binding transcriptional regulator AlpA